MRRLNAIRMVISLVLIGCVMLVVSFARNPIPTPIVSALAGLLTLAAAVLRSPLLLDEPNADGLDSSTEKENENVQP